MKYNSQLKYLSFYVIVKYLKYILFEFKLIIRLVPCFKY